MNRDRIPVQIAKCKEPAEWPISGRQHDRHASFHQLIVHGIRIGRGYPERNTPAEFVGRVQIDDWGADRKWYGASGKDNRTWMVLRQGLQPYLIHIKRLGGFKVAHLEGKEAGTN